MFARERLEEAARRRPPSSATAATCGSGRLGARLDRWLSGRLGAAFRRPRGRPPGVPAEPPAGGRRRCRRDRRRRLVPVAQRHGLRGGRRLDRRPARPRPGRRHRLWVEILRADVGQGRGDHRQMFGAARRREAAAHRLGRRPGRGRASPPTTPPWPTSPTRRRGPPRAGALDLAAGPATAPGHADRGVRRRCRPCAPGTTTRSEQRYPAVRTASEDGYDRFILHWAGWMLGLAEQDAGGARYWMDPPAGLPRPHRHRRDVDHVLLDGHVRRAGRRRCPDHAGSRPGARWTGRTWRVVRA